jgi:hypothetical protein
MSWPALFEKPRRVQAGEVAYGYLCFPDKDEAPSAKELRLGLKIGEQARVVMLPL